MNSLKYQVCNLISEQQRKGRLNADEIGKDMLDFYMKKYNIESTKEFMSFLHNQIMTEKNKLLKLFIIYTLNYVMIQEILHKEDSEEKEKMIEMGKPNLKNSFEEIGNFLKTKECNDAVKELSIWHQICKRLKK